MFWTLIFGVGVIAAYAAHIIYSKDKKPVYKNLSNKHVVVTGGSSGIGKSAACEAARLGAHVTIIGRDVEKLKQATVEIRCASSSSPNQIIQYEVLDVTSDYLNIEECFQSLETRVGPIFMLVNCAGACICGIFEQMSITDIQKMINLNYSGTAMPTRWVLPKMRERNEGIVVFVASEAAMVGIYGYSAYSAAKWAVRGLAEAVSMELVGTNVRVMLSYPPDTDTPGLHLENTTKPEETKIISGSGGLHSPNIVGKTLINDALIGKTYSVYSTSGRLLNILYGVSAESVLQLVTQIIFMGVVRAIMVGIFSTFDNVVRARYRTKTAAQKSQ